MGVKTRLKRLEAALIPPRKRVSIWEICLNVPEGFDPDRDLDPQHRSIWNSMVALPKWLQENGYADALSAVEAGETGPPGLEEVLREQATYDASQKAWMRIDRYLCSGEPPYEGYDLEAMNADLAIARPAKSELK